MAAVHTAAEHTLWRDRIRKETAINASPNRDAFSVRAAVRSHDVPMIFKPGHVNPTEHASRPCPIGSSSSMSRDFQEALSAQSASPRQRFIWPETSQHVVGWFHQCPVDGLPRGERRTLDGLPPRSNVGWVENSAIGAILPRAQEGAMRSAPSAPPRLKSSALGNNHFSAVTPTVAPEATPMTSAGLAASDDASGGLLMQAARAARKSKARPKPMPSTLSSRACAPPPSPRTRQRVKIVEKPTRSPRVADVDETSRKLVNADPWSCASKVGQSALLPTASQEQKIATAAERNKSFMNGPTNRWYKPVGSSDVAEFANAYTKSWGVPLFNRK